MEEFFGNECNFKQSVINIRKFASVRQTTTNRDLFPCQDYHVQGEVLGLNELLNVEVKSENVIASDSLGTKLRSPWKRNLKKDSLILSMPSN